MSVPAEFCPSRPANHEWRIEECLADRRIGLVDASHEHVKGQVRQFAAWLMRRRKRRRRDCRVVDVVESGDLNVLWHIVAKLRQR